MVGIIPKILLNLVGSLAGHEAECKVLKQAGLPGDHVFRLSEVYSDEQWKLLLKASCDCLKISESEALKAYAEAFGQDALARWPKWFAMSKNSKEFLFRQPKLHNYFASGVQDPEARKAITDKFSVEESGSSALITHYHSPNQLCELYVNLGEWVIRHYQDRGTINHKQCMKLGAPECEIHLRWETFHQPS